MKQYLLATAVAFVVLVLFISVIVIIGLLAATVASYSPPLGVLLLFILASLVIAFVSKGLLW